MVTYGDPGHNYSTKYRNCPPLIAVGHVVKIQMISCIFHRFVNDFMLLATENFHNFHKNNLGLYLVVYTSFLAPGALKNWFDGMWLIISFGDGMIETYF